MTNQRLNGMYWQIGQYDFEIPFIGDASKAVFIFKKNVEVITWNCLQVFEQNPATLTQTQTILKGLSVDGLKIDDLLKVKNYGDGARELVHLVRNNRFDLIEECACSIHKFVGYRDTLEWGTYRNLDIAIQDVKYTPPHFANLKKIGEEGFDFLRTQVADPKERAIALFLFMSRSQFFFDANKRTASLMMNGCLMQNGYWPITVLNRDSEEFHAKLGKFYETGNADEMMAFFEKSVKTLYPQQPDPKEEKQDPLES